MAASQSSTAAAASTAQLAAPAWRKFDFFGTKQIPDNTLTDLIRKPALISTIVASPVWDLVLLADLEGTIHVLDQNYQSVNSWSAYPAGGRCTHMVVAEDRRWKGVVVTVGDDPATPFPVLKIWDLGRTPAASSSTPPLLLRQTKLQPTTTSSRPHPVSALGISPSLSHLVIGFADGTVVAFRHVDQLVESSLASPSPPNAVLGLGKMRTIHDGKEPITGLGFRVSPSQNQQHRTSTTLFILTTSHVLSFPISSSKSATPAGGAGNHGIGGSGSGGTTVLDDLGSAVGCCDTLRTGLLAEGDRMVVARDEAIYVYGADGREGCYAYEGPKSSLHSLTASITSTSSSTSLSPNSPSSSQRTTYIAIVSPPLQPSIASASATIRNYARSALSSITMPATAPNSTTGSGGDVAKVTLFDLENKFVAHSGTFEEGVRTVWEAWGAVWVLSEGGNLYRLVEQPIASSLSTLFSKNLYTLAVSLAQSRDLPPSEVAEIYRRYGDHLYGKSDYEGAMNCYTKTVGTVQASYVIRKFLDAQRLSHLTSYLQELHSRGLANSDHTTLLLNCYTKLADDTALSTFIHSSSTAKPAATNGSSVVAPTPIPLPDLENGNKSTATTDEPPFDLETAIRVCRQAGYFDHAVWLAERYGEHQEYLRIQIEDRGDFKGSLKYLRKLGPRVAETNLLRYGKVLLAKEPKDTTRLLIDLCCGTLEKDEEEEEELARTAVENRKSSATDKGYLSYLAYAIPSTGTSEAIASLPEAAAALSTSPIPANSVQPPQTSHKPTNVAHLRSTAMSESSSANRRSGIYPQHQPLPGSSAASLSDAGAGGTPPVYLPSPRQFFANFVDLPKEFVHFLETVALRRYGKTIEGASPSLDPSTGPLPDPQSAQVPEFIDTDTRDEQAIWNTLLELYLDGVPSTEDPARAVFEGKALQLLRSKERIPYDETQALLVCSTAGFTPGFILLYEQLGMYDDIVRYYIEASTTEEKAKSSDKVIDALKRYGESRPHLYRVVLRFLTTSSELLSRHQADIIDILDVIDRDNLMPPIAVVQILSTNGTASVGLVREYLKKQLSREKQEIESDRSLIESYRTESAKKRKEIQELSDPNVPRIFQVTRCSACGGQLDLPAVHFMCRHSYHQRCLGENESQCPNCAKTHGVIREIRAANEALAGRHDLFVEEVRESEDGFATVAASFGKGLMSLAGSNDS
ncbi:hypothetical protein T439DRAFT_344059 [Meredithblackwellia eburnea MCA 4105]